MKKTTIVLFVCMLMIAGSFFPVSGTLTVGKKSQPISAIQLPIQEQSNAGEMLYFNSSDITELGQAAWGVTTADFNNDGFMDFAVGSADAPFSHATISIFYNDGAAGFTKHDVFTFDEYIKSLVCGDFNNDGAKDFLFGYSGSVDGVNVYGNVSLLLNDGNNNFGNATLVITRGTGKPDAFGRINPKIATGDYDLDGDLDVLFGDNSGKIELFYNDGTGTFTSQGIIHDWGQISWGVASGDFNSDGADDFLVSAEGTGRPYRSDIYLKLNQIKQSDATLPFDTSLGEPVAYSSVLSGSLTPLDYENDGDMDFVAAEMNVLRLYIYDQGTYFPCTIGTLPDYEDLTSGAIAAADFDSDGSIDFVAGGTQGIVRLFTNTNEHPFSAVLATPVLRHFTINEKSFPALFLKRTLLFGKTTLKLKTLGDVTKVELHINDHLKYTATAPPYEWTWDEKSFGKYTVQILASDGAGHHNWVVLINIWKFQRSTG